MATVMMMLSYSGGELPSLLVVDEGAAGGDVDEDAADGSPFSLTSLPSGTFADLAIGCCTLPDVDVPLPGVVLGVVEEEGMLLGDGEDDEIIADVAALAEFVGGGGGGELDDEVAFSSCCCLLLSTCCCLLLSTCCCL